MVLAPTEFHLQTAIEAAMEIAGLHAAQKRLQVCMCTHTHTHTYIYIHALDHAAARLHPMHFVCGRHVIKSAM